MGSPANHWCRKIMDESTLNLVSNLDYQNLDAVEISGKKWLDFKFKTYKNYFYPSFDICNVSSEYQNTADIVLIEQVLEHVKNPWKAIENIKKILRPGGYILVTTPFFLKVHGAPMDYWRWTKDGLSAMLEDSGLIVENAESWGNRDCIISNLSSWPDYQENDNLSNETDFPIVVWALARKI
jgi:SAM-dependent methyltransferase